MKFVLFVEGDTEKDVLPGLLKRCIDPELKQSVGIQPVNFHGWAKSKMEKEVGHHDRFRHYFAVHELEAWLLSQSSIFPKEVQKDIEAVSSAPEEVNFVQPPKKRLDAIYEHRLKRGYQPRIDGAKLFRAMEPSAVRSKCPLFSEMIIEMIALAKGALP